MLDAVEAAEKPPDFVGAENDGQLRRRFRGRDDLGEHPVLLERDPVEEAQGGDRDLYRTRCQLPFFLENADQNSRSQASIATTGQKSSRAQPPFLSHRGLT